MYKTDNSENNYNIKYNNWKKKKINFKKLNSNRVVVYNSRIVLAFSKSNFALSFKKNPKFLLGIKKNRLREISIKEENRILVGGKSDKNYLLNYLDRLANSNENNEILYFTNDRMLDKLKLDLKDNLKDKDLKKFIKNIKTINLKENNKNFNIYRIEIDENNENFDRLTKYNNINYMYKFLNIKNNNFVKLKTENIDKEDDKIFKYRNLNDYEIGQINENKGLNLSRGQMIKLKILDEYNMLKWISKELMYIGSTTKYIKYSEDEGETYKKLLKDNIVEIKKIKYNGKNKYIIPKLIDPISKELIDNQEINIYK